MRSSSASSKISIKATKHRASSLVARRSSLVALIEREYFSAKVEVGVVSFLALSGAEKGRVFLKLKAIGRLQSLAAFALEPQMGTDGFSLKAERHAQQCATGFPACASGMGVPPVMHRLESLCHITPPLAVARASLVLARVCCHFATLSWAKGKGSWRSAAVSLEVPRMSPEVPRMSWHCPQTSVEVPRMSLEAPRVTCRNPKSLRRISTEFRGGSTDVFATSKEPAGYSKVLRRTSTDARATSKERAAGAQNTVFTLIAAISTPREYPTARTASE